MNRSLTVLSFLLPQYFCNMYAERIKNQGKDIDESTRFMLEVYIPLFTVSVLLGVTG